MLISFAATNHRSLRERTELSFIAESRPPNAERALLAIPAFGLELVPALALVGPNGSGKSNIIDAIEFGAHAVSYSHSQWSPTSPPPRDPFLLKTGGDPRPSRYEYSFVVDGSVFEYIFSLGERGVVNERLRRASNGPRSWAMLYERSTSPEGAVRVKAGRQLRGHKAAAEAATRPNSLFLSSAAQNNHAELTPVWQWFRSRCRTATPSDRVAREMYTTRRVRDATETYKDRVRTMLSSVDLGIADVRVNEISIPGDELDAVRQFMSTVGTDESIPPQISDVLLRPTFEHRGDVGDIELDDESAGTRAWFEWASPILDTIDDGALLVADELDAHLNTLLAAELVGFFQKDETNRQGSQLIFATQDPGVLTATALGRDQVWIAEKDRLGATSLEPVTDFSARRNWDVGEAYRHGRFGGLPVVDETELIGAITRQPNSADAAK